MSLRAYTSPWNDDPDADTTVASIGPFQRFPVVVNGWTVPNLEAYEFDDRPGLVTLVCDNRFALDVPKDIADQVIAWLAQVTSVAMGWTCHPPSYDWDPPEFLSQGPSRSLPWRRMTKVGFVETEDQP